MKTKHYKTRLYRIWSDMKTRCFNSSARAYQFYGARGITVCEQWLKFQPFEQWALQNGYTDFLTIDRINTNGNYEPSNCRFVNRKQQANNTRKNTIIEHNKQKLTLSQWADLYGINYKVLWKRLNDGWNFEDAITTKKLTPSESAKHQKTKKVYCCELNLIFDSARQAQIYYFEHFGKLINVSRSCKSSYLKAGGFKWEYYPQP